MRLRLDTTVAGILGDLSKDRTLVQAHASILFAAQPVEPAEQLHKTAR
jgi:hypothetical protein